jgi:hypothetical protein
VIAIHEYFWGRKTLSGSLRFGKLSKLRAGAPGAGPQPPSAPHVSPLRSTLIWAAPSPVVQVKALEEAGVGRPSTYASTLRTLIERAYVRKEARRLIPEMRGLLVSAFLQHYFPRYVDTAFTARLEEQLDDITAGSRPYKAVLHSFNTDLQADIHSINEVSRQEVRQRTGALLCFFWGEAARRYRHWKKGAVALLSQPWQNSTTGLSDFWKDLSRSVNPRCMSGD